MTENIDHLFNEWIPEICINGIGRDFLVVENSAEALGEGKFRHIFKFKIYTENYLYHITAIENEEKDYLGCVSSTRKPSGGEDWTRGNDLPDGPFTYETWQKIKDGIIRYELVQIEPVEVEKVLCQNCTGPSVGEKCEKECGDTLCLV